MGATALAACGAGSGVSGGAADGSSAGAPSPRPSAVLGGTVRFSNWPLYIDDPDGTGSPTIAAFTEATGVEVAYTEDINDGAEFLAKVRLDLEAGRDIGRDIVVLSEETSQVLVELGYALRLDPARIPNARNLLPRLRAASFDPDRHYSLPWQSGFTGFGYNTGLLRERLGTSTLTTFEQFLDPRLAGRVSLLSETMDTMGLVLRWQGFDAQSFTDAQFEAALGPLRQAVDSGQIRQVTGNDYIAGLESGDLIAAIGWSGDVLSMGEGFGFSLPESGGIVWADSMLIPRGAVNPDGAQALMNHYYDPEVAARLAAAIQYSCPVEGAQEAMASIDPALVDDPWIFPDDALLDSCQVTAALTLDRMEVLDRAYDDTVNR